MLARAGDAAEIVGVLAEAVGLGVFEQHLAIADHRVQGRAQLMAHARDEFGFRLARELRLLARAGQLLGETGQSALGIREVMNHLLHVENERQADDEADDGRRDRHGARDVAEEEDAPDRKGQQDGGDDGERQQQQRAAPRLEQAEFRHGQPGIADQPKPAGCWIFCGHALRPGPFFEAVPTFNRDR
jgi:hypothetical protein